MYDQLGVQVGQALEKLGDPFRRLSLAECRLDLQVPSEVALRAERHHQEYVPVLFEMFLEDAAQV